MANFRDRLKRIQQLQKIKNARPDQNVHDNQINLTEKGWVNCGTSGGQKVLKREITVPSPFRSKKILPQSLKIIVSDLAGYDMPAIKDFLFFDLETTGLSGGAGTTAFLAAFGKVISDKLLITQYLLLDYPGENDFLENVLLEIKNGNPTIISFNGKTFDSQILKTRCLMNRIKPPDYKHADLLHPARRLWKNIIYDCSQVSIETNILGLDRERDIPGSLAPEIWFEFLKTGRTDRLLGICDHNKTDITGLAKIFAAMIFIAEDPFNVKRLKYDLERLALYWRQYLRRAEFPDDELKLTGSKLLRFAAEMNYPRAVYIYGYDQMRTGNYNEALEFAKRGLNIFLPKSHEYGVLLRRKIRLETKIL